MFSDLIFVLSRIKDVIESVNLPALYNDLAGAIQQAAGGSTPELQTQIKEVKEQIRKAHNELSTNGWSYSQKQVFDRFGAAGVVGIDGLKYFEAAFSDNAPSAVVNELHAQSGKISQLLTNTNNVIIENSSEGQGIVQIVFKDEAAIDNLSDLSKQSESWEKIVRAYSILTDEAPENTKIIATNKINPFFLWLATPPLISKAIHATIKPLLDLWHEILDLQAHALALEEKKIEIKEKQLMKQIQEREAFKLNEILEKVAIENSKPELSEGKKNEGKMNLLKFGPYIYDFIKAHGEVDASQDGKSSQSTSNLHLASRYIEIYSLESKVKKMLNAPKPESAPSPKDKKPTKQKEGKDEGNKKPL